MPFRLTKNVVYLEFDIRDEQVTGVGFSLEECPPPEGLLSGPVLPVGVFASDIKAVEGLSSDVPAQKKKNPCV